MITRKPLAHAKVRGESVKSLRHRVQVLEAREMDVLAQGWSYDNKLAQLQDVADQINAATVLNEETKVALEAFQADLLSREAALLAREAAIVERDSASAKREAAAAMLDAQNANSIIEKAIAWFEEYADNDREGHLCAALEAGEKAGHPIYAVAYAAVAYTVNNCDCGDDDDD